MLQGRIFFSVIEVLVIKN